MCVFPLNTRQTRNREVYFVYVFISIFFGKLPIDWNEHEWEPHRSQEPTVTTKSNSDLVVIYLRCSCRKLINEIARQMCFSFQSKKMMKKTCRLFYKYDCQVLHSMSFSSRETTEKHIFIIFFFPSVANQFDTLEKFSLTKFSCFLVRFRILGDWTHKCNDAIFISQWNGCGHVRHGC